MPPLSSLMIQIAILAGVILSFAGILVLIRHRHAKRISDLRKEIDEITGAEIFHERVSRSAGDGELAELEDAVNQVFEAVHSRDRKLRQQDQLFQNLAGSVEQAIVIHRNTILFANTRVASLRGVRRSDLVGRPFLELVHPDYRTRVEEMIAAMLAGEGQPASLEVQFLDRNGNGVWVRLSVQASEYEDQTAILSAILDISHEKALEEALAQGKMQTRVTLESLAEGVVTTDVFGKIDYINSAAEELTGVGSADALGRRFSDLVSLLDEADRKAVPDPVTTCLKRGTRVALGGHMLLLAREEGVEISVDVSASPIMNLKGQTVGVVLVLRDVSEQRGLTRQMSYQASHDALTGLINRREFERRLEECLPGARAGDASHVLCYLDLDRFKAVNDTCGHIAGDNLLRELAGLIKEKVRDSDTVGRLGGDEFGMLLVGCPLDKARQIADDVVGAINAYRFVWRDKIFTLGVSIGLVEIGRESGGLEDLLSAADSACYIAKQQGRGQVHVYSARDEAVARHRGEIMWLKRLQSALREDRFELYSQPIVSASGRVETGPAVEVFLRMRDEQDQEIAPAEFMRAAERYQIMPHIDRWVVQTTLAAIGRGTVRLPDQRSCAINLSGQTLGDEQFLEFVVECLDRTGVTPEQICFEVTEPSVVANLSYARRFISVLHGMGCQFALDDFGSGIGSFSNLKSLDIDYLKIDGSYTRDLGSNSVNRAMISAMIELAGSLRFQVVAEQVEEQEDFDAVRALGVDFVQGFAVGRPRSLRSSSLASSPVTA